MTGINRIIEAARSIVDATTTFIQAVEATTSIMEAIEAEGPRKAPEQPPPERESLVDTTRESDKPCGGLIALVLMVKNEESGIIATLDSFLPYVDAVFVYDTGSTDRTRDLVREHLIGREEAGDKLRWLVHEEPFIDFSASRNRALDMARDRLNCDFTLMPDADDRLSGGWALRAFLQDRVETHDFQNEVDGGYMVNMFGGGTVGDYYLPLVLRTSQGWRYTGKVHEYVSGSQLPNVRIPGVKISKHPTPKSIEATKKRWERDKIVLEAEVEKDPSDARSMFYLAQTLECLGEREPAAHAYLLRSRLGGWVEETCEALMRRARLMDEFSDAVFSSLRQAHSLCPDRAEPLFAIAERYQVEKNWPLAYLYGLRAAGMPMTGATLFVDREVYEWKAANLVAIVAFYLHQQTGDLEVHATGKRMADRVLARKPDDMQTLSNRAWYARSAAETFGATHQEINYKPGIHDGAQYYPSNPSVHYDGKRLRCILRTTNYRIVNGEYLTPNDNIIFTRNVMLELDPGLLDQSGSNVLTTVDMLDYSSRETWPRSDFPVHGFEDCRLFSSNGLLYATATVCDFDGDKGSREIVLLDIGKNDYQILRARPLRGEWSKHHQKNWMPFADQGRQLSVVYSTDPLQVLRPDRTDAWCVDSGNMGRLRGGSQLIPWGRPVGDLSSDRYIALVHEVTFPGGRDRVYLHRFVEFTEQVRTDWVVGGPSRGMKVTGMSEPFYFHNRGIEFCAGLVQVGERLVASYGANDCGAFLAVFDVAKVANLIIPVRP